MWCNSYFARDLDRNFPRNVWKSLRRHLCKIDPNWCTAHIQFSKSGRIIKATLNGPKLGNGDFLPNLSCLIDGKLPDLLKRYAFLPDNKRDVIDYGLWFHNPSYKIELINGRTEISFEHCVSGIVQNYDPQKHTFEVQNLRDMFSGKSEMFTVKGRVYNKSWKMTVQELKLQLKDDGPNFQAVGIYYLALNEQTE